MKNTTSGLTEMHLLNFSLVTIILSLVFVVCISTLINPRNIFVWIAAFSGVGTFVVPILFILNTSFKKYKFIKQIHEKIQ